MLIDLSDLSCLEIIVAGWAGRDQQQVQHHIDELAAIGVAPPSKTPIFYQISPDRFSQEEVITVVGGDTSGEVEPVIVWKGGKLLVGVGSDHTDRDSERFSVAVSKQLCPKVVGKQFWEFDAVIGHWDDLKLRSYRRIEGVDQIYQDGRLSELLRPEKLIEDCRVGNHGRLEEGSLLFCGTVSTIGGISGTEVFTIELHDPVTGTMLRHQYRVHELTLVS